MKSNVLKSSLAAFVFTLAMVASFAFSPALNDEVAVNEYYQILDNENPLLCVPIDPVCDRVLTAPVCCIQIGITEYYVYQIQTSSTSCSVILKDSTPNH